MIVREPSLENGKYKDNECAIAWNKYYKQYAVLSELAGGKNYKGKQAVKFHKEKFGKQSYTHVGFSRWWVWEFDGAKVLVGSRGIVFEVEETLSVENAMDKWEQYFNKMMGR